MNPQIKLAELIGGRVYMPSPVSVRHGNTDHGLSGWTFLYMAATPGLAGNNNTTTYLLQDVVQPEVNLRLLPEYGGKSRQEGAYLAGPPESIKRLYGNWPREERSARGAARVAVGLVAFDLAAPSRWRRD